MSAPVTSAGSSVLSNERRRSLLVQKATRLISGRFQSPASTALCKQRRRILLCKAFEGRNHLPENCRNLANVGSNGTNPLEIDIVNAVGAGILHIRMALAVHGTTILNPHSRSPRAAAEQR